VSKKHKKKSQPIDIEKLFPEEGPAQMQCHCGSGVVGPLKLVKQFMKEHRHEKQQAGFRA